MRTEQEWLKLYAENKAEFKVEIAKVVTPGPWKHDVADGCEDFYCHKCGKRHKHYGPLAYDGESCPIPDPIDSGDWNVAMEVFRANADLQPLEDIYRATLLPGFVFEPCGFTSWLVHYAQPHHYLIAAAKAKEGE